jgi:hypothetical protein
MTTEKFTYKWLQDPIYYKNFAVNMIDSKFLNHKSLEVTLKNYLSPTNNFLYDFLVEKILNSTELYNNAVLKSEMLLDIKQVVWGDCLAAQGAPQALQGETPKKFYGKFQDYKDLLLNCPQIR